MALTLLNYFGENPSENKYKSFNLLVFWILTYSLSYFYIAYTLAYFTTFGSVLLNVNYGIPYTGFFRVLYMALITFGAAFGVFACKFIPSTLAKRQMVMIINGFALLFGSLILWIEDIYLVFIIRFCQGVCVGIYSILIPNILKQISPQKTLNRIVSINYSIFGLALVLAYTLAYEVSSVYKVNESAGMGWTISCAFPLVFIAIQSLLLQFKFPFETTEQYLKQNRNSEAQTILDYFYQKWYAMQILKKIEQQIRQSQKSQDIDAEINTEQNQLILSNRNQNLNNPLMMNKEKYFQRKRSKYNLVAVFSIVLLRQFSGIQALILYAFWLSFNAISDKLYFPIILFVILMFSAQIMPVLMDKINRKTIVMVSTVVCALSSSLISYGMYYNEDPSHNFTRKNSGFLIVGLLLLAINYGCSVGPIFNLYSEQIMPEHFFYIVKAFSWGAGAFVVMGCSTDWRTSVIFLILSIWALVSILINFKVQIQTRCKTKSQIEEEYFLMAASF